MIDIVDTLAANKIHYFNIDKIDHIIFDCTFINKWSATVSYLAVSGFLLKKIAEWQRKQHFETSETDAHAVRLVIFINLLLLLVLKLKL